MSVNSNKLKSEQLGMPFGTTQNRLRKKIMFETLKKYGDNRCFKCGELITNESELSVEHKIPWLHNNPELFWDLENIAFSHLKCNRPDRPNGKKRKEAPEGYLWCSRCNQLLEVGRFVNTKSRNGKSSHCHKCRKSY